VPVVNAMSIDVEDYFHVSALAGVVARSDWGRMQSRVVSNTTRLLDLFDEFGIRSTFFVLGWVAERHRDLVKTIANRGHELASHGYGHQLIYDQTPGAFRDDVRLAKQLLEDASGQRIFGYRAPSFSVTSRSLWALDVLAEEGYEYDASIFPIRHDRYGIPSAERKPHVINLNAGSIIEVPATTTRVANINLPVAGGGYFRLLPYWWTRWGITRVNLRERVPAIFYLHPWEVDPQQPRLTPGALNAFRHYRNLDQTEARLRRLLNDFRFGTVAAVIESLRATVARAPAAPSSLTTPA
jgi:polysaccharide deacetylase family protein (PEP-CTERM system associated)